MKKFLIILVMVLGLFMVNSCKKNNKFIYNYEFEELSKPFWESDIIYNESILLSEDEDGNIYGNLAFKPLEIYSIRDYTLQNEYKKGVDWDVDGRKIIYKEGSSCPFFTKENMHGVGIENNTEIRNVNVDKDPEDLLFTTSYEIFMNQIFVTYKYDRDAVINDIPVPENQSSKIPLIKKASDEKSDLNILILGDSISGGGQSSSNGNIEPFCPDWVNIYGEAVQRYINKKSNSHMIVNVENKSVGGQVSGFSIDMNYSPNGKDSYCEYHVKRTLPDIVVISYGMNDGTWGVPAEKYVDNIKKTIEQCKNASSKPLNFIVVNTMQPNNNGGGWLYNNGAKGGTPAYGIQYTYAQPLKELCDSLDDVVFVNMWDISGYLLANKKFEDMTVNNLNHPNDFMIRVYAMFLQAATLE